MGNGIRLSSPGKKDGRAMTRSPSWKTCTCSRPAPFSSTTPGVDTRALSSYPWQSFCRLMPHVLIENTQPRGCELKGKLKLSACRLEVGHLRHVKRPEMPVHQNAKFKIFYFTLFEVSRSAWFNCQQNKTSQRLPNLTKDRAD